MGPLCRHLRTSSSELPFLFALFLMDSNGHPKSDGLQPSSFYNIGFFRLMSVHLGTSSFPFYQTFLPRQVCAGGPFSPPKPPKRVMGPCHLTSVKDRERPGQVLRSQGTCISSHSLQGTNSYPSSFDRGHAGLARVARVFF